MQGGDGSLRRKVPGGLAGRTWLYYSYHQLLLPHLEGALGFSQLVFFLFFFLFSLVSVVLCLTLFTRSGDFFFLLQFVLFQVLATWSAGGGHDK